MATPLDNEVSALARRITDLGSDEKTSVYRMSWWSERLMAWAMARPGFKTQLFRFVDVFPAMTDDRDVLRHVEQYFDGDDIPKLMGTSVNVASHIPLGSRITARVARRNITRMAEQFVVGSTAPAAVAGLHRLWSKGNAFTVDLLGEKTVTESEADRYAARVDELLRALTEATPKWKADPRLERDDLGPLPRANLSLKPTALASLFSPLSRDDGIAQAKERLLPILKLAAEQRAFIYFDMEHYDVKDMTLQLFRELLDLPELADLEAGIVIQAYLKDSRADLADVISWSAGRARPVTVRLVKGAYWDSETIHSRYEGWPVPVFEDKAETDANYERCIRLLHDHHGEIRAGFASHNLRSLAYAIAYARDRGIPDNGYELQMLYGMAEPLHAAVRALGLRLRVYAPVGELVPGMAYLVRRLLENTSNESFVRHRFAEGQDVDTLVAPPEPDTIPDLPPPVRRPATDPSQPGPYHHEPPSEWRRQSERQLMADAVARVELGRDVPAVIAGQRVNTPEIIESVDPADPATVVARSAACGAAEADRAIAAAKEAWPAWQRTPARERAAVLFRAGQWMRERRHDLAALQVFEAGKPWKEADADLCEAIDFCEYYGREMLRLDQGGAVESPPGETNVLHYQGKGIGAVIAPWNFPLAIPTGMVTAALVTGNAVLFKPAEQTPAIAYALVEALEAGGLPPGVLAFLPGRGEVVGDHIVRHPDVSFITFTGSREVGLAINAAAAQTQPGQRHVKRVVAEMGGKNALIVDSDADLDQAVPAIVYSAFGFAGQKCSAASRLIALDSVHDELVARLVGATAELRIGHPRDMGVHVGPVIEADAQARVRRYTELAGRDGRIVAHRADVPDNGFFAGPVIVTDIDPSSPVASDEIFGPVLCVLRARDFDHALQLANDTDYALTAGVISRSPDNIRRAAAELRAGNVYVNRTITGAQVGRQPFGGFGLSGVGSKAGGPDYLLQFLDPRTVTENTIRQGFAPLED